MPTPRYTLDCRYGPEKRCASWEYLVIDTLTGAEVVHSSYAAALAAVKLANQAAVVDAQAKGSS
jgi:hypothetical protein